MFKNVMWIVAAVVFVLPSGLQAAFEYESILKEEIDGPIVDVAANPADELVFVLTPGQIVIYSTENRSILDRIPVDAGFDRIAFQADDRLVLTAKQPAKLDIIRYKRIFDIDIQGRAVKGPPDARVTIVVFDDYQ